MASGRLIVSLAEPALNASGLVAPGTTWTTYETGTNTLATMYADPGLTTPIANPQIANSAGRFEEQATVFWLDASAAYDVLLNFPDGSSIPFNQLYVLGAATNTSGFAPINSPAFTGDPTAPTPATNDDSQNIATTAYVQNQGYAPTASPTFTGVPEAPTAAPGTDTTQLATTAFVDTAITGAQAFFQSGEIAIANGSASKTVAHGLGVIPVRVQLFIRCKASNNGYPVGCEIPMNIDSSYQGGSVQAEGGVAFAVSATNVGYVIGGAGLTCLAVSPAGNLMSQASAPSAPDWVIFIRAWAH